MTKEEVSEKNRNRYQRLKEQGLCIVCGKVSVAGTGYVQCKSCTEHKEELRKKRYEKRKESGICVNCKNNPALPGKVTCAKCTAKSKEYHKSLYYFNQQLGLCVRCGKEKANSGNYCLICRMDRNEKRKPKTEEQKQHNREKSKETREKRKAEGKCPLCGRDIPKYSDKIYCAYCRNRANRNEREREQARGRLPQSLRGNGVYCYICCKPVENEGEKLCNHCRETATKNLLEGREKAPKDNIFRRKIEAQWRDSERWREEYRKRDESEL